MPERVCVVALACVVGCIIGHSLPLSNLFLSREDQTILLAYPERARFFFLASQVRRPAAQHLLMPTEAGVWVCGRVAQSRVCRRVCDRVHGNAVRVCREHTAQAHAAAVRRMTTVALQH